MRLDANCIRDILLTVEDFTAYHKWFEYHSVDKSNYPLLSKYQDHKLTYHFDQCNSYGFFKNCHIYRSGEHISIQDLTPKGHDFIDNIRDNTVWNKVLKGLHKLGVYSLSTLIQISGTVVADLTKTAIINIISNN